MLYILIFELVNFIFVLESLILRRNLKLRNGTKCRFSHEIPDHVRQDKEVRRRIKEERDELWRRKAVLMRVFPPTVNQQNEHNKGKSSKSRKAPCLKSFKNKGSCKIKNCPDEHNLDYAKISNGICFDDLDKEGSCKRGPRCRFTHEIPSILRQDKLFCQDAHEKKKSLAERKKDKERSKIVKQDDFSNSSRVSQHEFNSIENIWSPNLVGDVYRYVQNQQQLRK